MINNTASVLASRPRSKVAHGRSNIIIINSQFESATAPIFIIQTRQVQLSYNICQLIIKKGNIYIDQLMKYIFPLTRYRAEKKWREYI